jgi:hypothetical protein
VTHIRKAKYIYVNDRGCKVTIEDHDILVCPGLPTHIISIPNWAKQVKQSHGDRDKIPVTSYGNVTYIYTDQNCSKRTVAHLDQEGRIRRKDRHELHHTKDGSDDAVCRGFIVYRQLIRVPYLSIRNNKDHNIGSSLLSIITIFNLAMVMHLRVISNAKNNTNNDDNNRATIEKTLQLYEVAYNALEKYKKDNNDRSSSTTSMTTMNETSIQFKMILCNSLSHIHRLAGNHSKHEQYLRELLSTVMCVIDSKKSRTTNGNDDDDDE